MDKKKFKLETLEERIAPSITGQGGYEGQPGNQSNGGNGNPGNNNPGQNNTNNPGNEGN